MKILFFFFSSNSSCASTQYQSSATYENIGGNNKKKINVFFSQPLNGSQLRNNEIHLRFNLCINSIPEFSHFWKKYEASLSLYLSGYCRTLLLLHLDIALKVWQVWLVLSKHPYVILCHLHDLYSYACI